ncbi:MAG: UvrD-helicase domain-containing protein, partial [Persicimonas sp.]
DTPFFSGKNAEAYVEAVECGLTDRAATAMDTGEPITPIEILEFVPLDEDLRSGPARAAMRERIAVQIDEILRGKARFEVPDETSADRERRPVEPGDIFVLTRQNKEADKIGEALARRGIPHAFYRKDGLFQTAEASHIQTLLRAVVDPSERSRRRKAYLTPFFEIPLDAVEAVDARTGAGSPRERLGRWHSRADYVSYEKLFDEILRESGIIRRTLLFDDGERRLTNYCHIFELLTEDAATSDLTLRELLARLKARIEQRDDGDDDEESNLQRLESDRSAVQLMTMHKAKGLQAEVVFVYNTRSFSNRSDWKSLREPDGGETRLYPKDFELPERLARHKERSGQEEIERLLYVAITRARSKLYLPYTKKKRLRDWRGKTTTLHHLMNRIEGIRPRLEQNDLFEFSTYNEDDVGAPEIGDLDGWTGALENWEVPDFLAASPIDCPVFKEWRSDGYGAASDIFETLRSQTRTMTSYSGAKRSKATDIDEAIATEDDADDDDLEVYERPDDALPGGTGSGSYLHDILEHLDYETASNVDNFGAWAKLDEVAEVIDRFADLYGFAGDDELAEKRRAYTERILHRTLRAEVDNHDGEAFRIADLEPERLDREVRFVFPLPQTDLPSFGAASSDWPNKGAVDIRRGYVEGFIDLLFEHDGKVFFADWKSDTPEHGFAPEVVERYIDHRYPLQARVYTMALCRMFGINSREAYRESFGGFYYFLVRGMHPGAPDRGVYYEKPSWEEVAAVEDALTECDDDEWLETLRAPSDELLRQQAR